MYAVRLRVRGIVGREAAEFEKDVIQPEPPNAWMPRHEGRGGQDDPLFLAGVRWSAVFGAYVCLCEDGVADDLGSLDRLAQAYARRGWKELRRVSLYVQRPQPEGRVMNDPLDTTPDSLELTPQQMSRRELADAIEALARDHCQTLGEDGDRLLVEAADRLRALEGIREALCDKVAEVEWLRNELATLGGEPPGDDLAAVAMWRRKTG